MKTFAIIPARGGSKGVPGKNIKTIAGKPLIAWSIEQALASSKIDRAFVSTDCEQIAGIARQSGAEVPFLRPEAISGDTASTESAVMHWLSWLQQHESLPDNILLIQGTSPIRQTGIFDRAIDFFIEGNFDSALSVCPSHRFFWKQAAEPESSYDYRNRPRRQDIPLQDRQFMETGSFYLTTSDTWVACENRLGGRIGLFETTEEEGFEIDSFSDFVVCEALLNHLLEHDRNYQR